MSAFAGSGWRTPSSHHSGAPGPPYTAGNYDLLERFGGIGPLISAMARAAALSRWRFRARSRESVALPGATVIVEASYRSVPFNPLSVQPNSEIRSARCLDP